MSKKKKRKRAKRSTLPFLIFLVVVVVFAGYTMWHRKETENQVTRKDGAKSPMQSSADTQYVTYEGQKYEYNTDLKTILFMGVDKTQESTEAEQIGRNGQADSIILAVADKSKKEIKLLQVPRDSMTEIDLYDMSGGYLASEKAQLALQFAYGDGGKESSLLVKEKVSELFYEVPIQSYMTLHLEGIGSICDALGGVPVEMPQDLTHVDPDFQKGSIVNLKGAQAERYIRYRDTGRSGSSLERIERQNYFLDALIRHITEDRKLSNGDYMNILAQAGDYLLTDLSADEIKELTEYKVDSEVYTIPGEMVLGEKHDEYYVDDKKLYEIIIKVFYKTV